jgi:hypothetical protein
VVKCERRSGDFPAAIRLQQDKSVWSGHLQIGQLRPAQRPLGGVLREDEEHPAGRRLARPGDEVGALSSKLPAEAELMAALTFRIRSIEHCHLGLGYRAHLGHRMHRGECTRRGLVVFGRRVVGWAGCLPLLAGGAPVGGVGECRLSALRVSGGMQCRLTGGVTRPRSYRHDPQACCLYLIGGEP